MQFYKDILAKAWHHTIMYPSLWIFGLFAALVFGNGGELDRYLRYMNDLVAPTSPVNVTFWTQHHWSNAVGQFATKLSQGDISTIVFFTILIISALIIGAMMMISVGGLIAAANKQAHTFTEIFQSGIRHAAQLFVLHVGAYMVVAVCTLSLTFLVLQSGITSINQAQQMIVFISAIVFIPIVLILSFLVHYAASYIVLQNDHLAVAIKKAWQLFLRHWLVTLEMSIVMFVALLAINLAVLLACFIMAAPFLAVLAAQAQLQAQMTTISLVGGLAYLGVVVLVGAILSTWQITVWTILFQRLQTEQPDSTLLRLFKPRS